VSTRMHSPFVNPRLVAIAVAGALLLVTAGAFAQDGRAADATKTALTIEKIATDAKPAADPKATDPKATDPKATDPKTKTDDQKGAPKAPPKAMAKTVSKPAGLTRWFDFQTASASVRYRYLEASPVKGKIASSLQDQSQFALKGRFKFDKGGRYSFTTMAGSGTSYTGSWNNAGWGTTAATNITQRTFVVRQMYFSASPVKGFEATWGSFSPWRGESTEITTLDNDGWVSGERFSVKRPKDLYFDEAGVTIAFLGDTAKTNFFERYKGVVETPNYFQYYASKKINKYFTASGDYLRWAGVPWMHAGVSAKVPLYIVDTVRFENYVRGGAKADSGYSIYGERTLVKKFTAGFGYATIDPNFGGLNADRFNKGNRVYEQISYKLIPELTVSVFATQAVNTAFSVTNKYRFDMVVAYNALASFQRAGYFK
jgi:hypothetical protein